MKNNDFNKFPLVQIAAIDEYEKGNFETSKSYPSLELVRLEQVFFKDKFAHILEYGFGSGCNTEHLLKKGYKVTGIDVSKNAIKFSKQRLKKYYKKVQLLRLLKNSKKLPFKNNNFDYIVILSVLSLLGSKKKIQYLLSELSRVLKPKGKIILDINSINSEFGQKKISKNIYQTKILKNKILTYCSTSLKDFENLVSKHFRVKDKGYTKFKIFNRKIEEFIISAINKK
jgi:ubiquinone/menaquinone biosynthesis C-methylase UbiE